MKKKYLLFNPGPTNVSEAVRSAIKTRDICHREKEFFAVLEAIRRKILKVVNGEKTHTAVVFVSSATGANESIISSIHGKILLIENGKYSERLRKIAERYSIPMTVLKFDPMKPIDLRQVEVVLSEDKSITHMVIVHHETTTGMVLPLREIGKLAKKYQKILFADTVSSFGGYEIDVIKDNLAFFTLNSCKGLQSFPGLAVAIVRKNEILKLKGKSRSFYFDLYANWEKEENQKQLLFTPAVQLFFALNKALDELLKEGIKNRIKRYQGNAQLMRAGLRKMGFKFVLPDELQSNVLTSIYMPKIMDYWKVHDKLKERGFTIYSGQETLNEGIFRIATFGHTSRQDVKLFLKVLEEILKELNYQYI